MRNEIARHNLFIDSLALEWKLRSSLFLPYSPCTIYFGGGTPSLLSPHLIGKILTWITYSNTYEITLEINPENVTYDHLCAWRDLGINRLSMGVQSLDNQLLARIGRTHTAHAARQAVENAARTGFDNISIDLMFDLPGQELNSWKATLNEALSLPVTHFSLYNLTLEPPSRFYTKKETIAQQMPSEEVSLSLLESALEAAEQKGFNRYEISAFAKEGFESKHNLGYWQGRPFIGFGPSAFSYWEGARFQNVANLQQYTKILESKGDPTTFTEKLVETEKQREALAIALRVLEGVVEWPQSLEEEKDQLMDSHLLERTATHYRLTKKGLLFHDTVGRLLMGS